MAVDSPCSNRLQSLKFVDDTLVLTILTIGDINLWPFDLEPGARHCLSGGQRS